jgi:tetratricopeptide (TPR) repeat protein
MPISLNFDPYIELSKGIIGLKELIYLLLHVGILVFGVLQYKKRKYLTFGIFWFYLVLSVESSFIPIRDVMFDHRVYLPSLGFFTILVLFFYPFLRKRKKVATFMIILLVLSYSFKSFKRNEVWENDLVFWQDVVSKPPVKARSYSFLGIEYMFAGKYSKALRAFNKSIEKDPGRWQEHNNKAVIYIALKQYEKALKEYDMCIKKDDSNPDHYINRAEIYLALGKLERFNKDLEIAESLGNVSDNAIYYALKGKYYLQIGKNNEAISNLDIAISIDPKDVDAINNRGIAKMRIQKYEESIIDFSTVIRIDHTFLHAFQNRGEAWFLSGNFNNSLADFNHVITKDKASGRSYKLRGLTYLKLRNYPLAYEDLKIAQKYGENLDPKMMQDLSNYLSGDI